MTKYTYNNIELPNEIALNFRLYKVFEGDENKGLGKGIEYRNGKASALVHIYDKHHIVPDDISDDIVLLEFGNIIYEASQERNWNILSDAHSLVDRDGVAYLVNSFGIDYDGYGVITILSLTTIRGSFLKLRYTFVNDYDVQERTKEHGEFLGALSACIASQKHPT